MCCSPPFIRGHRPRMKGYRYLDCGILHNGFARVRCGECGYEYLLAFSCKRRHFYPSCHGEQLLMPWILPHNTDSLQIGFDRIRVPAPLTL